ncbi:uncharacterized protein MELLADRAFT_109090 [Melampsora larici-populina 98AG31]|uniref:Uncharacterized protein n=1 Tax=Melampsora larici-populina (strain 98AG31 / pathotype 3-4-7) TaxID=747676 RepID=F4RVA3_MELLP|nr:uncharacterized protein MELLADRAFT_109090 [Melampsora larici-populina 98AG31]EGG03702.1 hypothetical protein MELLADRAFT_109090 [Melampsora larici-populina 98AG31]
MSLLNVENKAYISIGYSSAHAWTPNSRQVDMSSTPSLPVEVIELIVFHLCHEETYLEADQYNSAEVDFLNQDAMINLLRLRLLNKGWASTIHRAVYGSLNLAFPYAEGFLNKLRCNNLAISEFCEVKGRSVKVLEVMPTYYEAYSTRLIVAFRFTLEVFFMDSLPNYIPYDLQMMEFPKLRVIRNIYVDGLIEHPDWFSWPMFRGVQILITQYHKGNSKWRKQFIEVLELPLPPGLKHMIFVVDKKYIIEDEVLTERLKTLGIGCHFKTRLSHYEILYNTRGVASEVNCNTCERHLYKACIDKEKKVPINASEKCVLTKSQV